MKTQDTNPLEQFCGCRACRGKGMTTVPRCQAMTNPLYRQPYQCNTPAKPGSKYCGNHKSKEEKQ